MIIKKINEWVEPKDDKILQDIIKKLEDLSVDGETFQHIIEEVGMKDQMISQLLKSYPESLNELLLH